MKRFFFYIVVLCGALFFASGLSLAETTLLRGEHTITYDIINPEGVWEIPDYSNDSFSQKIIEADEYSKRVVVSIKLHPLNSKIAFPLPSGIIPNELLPFLKPEKDIQSDNPAIIEAARRITKGATTLTAAVDRIVNFAMDHINYVINTKQDALSALRNGRGSCQGFSNLCVAMLRSLGVPARTAVGYLPPGYDWGISKDYWGVKTHGGGYHMWFEAYYPDTGWTFTDAQHSKNFVDPFHVLMGIPAAGIGSMHEFRKGFVDVDRGTSFTVFDEKNTTEPVDEVPGPEGKKLLGRVSQDFIAKGAVRGTIADEGGKPIKGAQVVIWKGSQGRVMPAREDGRYGIVGLKKGSVHLTFKAIGYAPVEHYLELGDVEDRILNVTLEPGAQISGKVVCEGGRLPKGTTVTLWEEGRGTVAEVGKDGSFEFPSVGEGEYVLTVKADGLKGDPAKVTVKKGETKEIVMTVHP